MGSEPEPGWTDPLYAAFAIRESLPAMTKSLVLGEAVQLVTHGEGCALACAIGGSPT